MMNDRVKESQVLNSILRAYGTRPEMRLWRANAGGAKFGQRMVKFGVEGQADLTGILPVQIIIACPSCGCDVASDPMGVRLEIECKSPTGTQREVQKQYEAMIKKFHGIYILARSVDDVARRLKDYGF